MKELVIRENEAGQRMDKLLIKYLNLAPKSFIYKMLRKKNITLNGGRADGSEKLTVGDTIKLFLSDETIEKFSKVTIQKTEYKLDILYEDKNVLIINKPAGILSQKAKSDDVSINEYIISYLLDTKQLTEEELKSFRPSVCNRLDRNTSGILAAGKTLGGLQGLSRLFKERDIDKYYLCIVSGKIEKADDIEGYLIKDEKTNKVEILKEGKEGASLIKTKYEPLKFNDDFTLMRVKLITGKTHQIRAHLASIDHPIIGDIKYGRKKSGAGRQMLHSYELIFPELDGNFKALSSRDFKAPLPVDFKKILEEEFHGDLEY
jgi:23S rRNA pseudouridine955/2504/2580 synthase